MYIKKTEIIGICAYKFFEDNLFFIQKEEGKNKFFANFIGVGQEGFISFLYFNNTIFLGSKLEKGLFKYNPSNHSVEKVNEKSGRRFIGSHIVYKSVNATYEYYNEKLELEFNSKNHYTLIHKGFGIERERKGLDWTGNINGYSLPNTKLWHFPLSTIAPLPHDTDMPDTVSEIIGVASQKIWVTTEAGRLLVLDIETGELLKIFSHHESDKQYGYEYNEGFGSIYIKENDDDYLYCMGNSYFSIIDARTVTINERVKHKELDPNGMKQFEYVYSPLLQGDYFTFIGRKYGESGGIRHVGIFDYTTKKLVWQYQVINEEEIAKGNELIAPEPLYISGNKLYIKDFHQTLHIFEKEENIT